jgi:hypothetical protein
MMARRPPSLRSRFRGHLLYWTRMSLGPPRSKLQQAGAVELEEQGTNC